MKKKKQLLFKKKGVINIFAKRNTENGVKNIERARMPFNILTLNQITLYIFKNKLKTERGKVKTPKLKVVLGGFSDGEMC